MFNAVGLLDTKTNHILLIGAELTPPPAGGRGRQLVPDSFSILVVGK
jgi:hypothetical protein